MAIARRWNPQAAGSAPFRDSRRTVDRLILRKNLMGSWGRKEMYLCILLRKGDIEGRGWDLMPLYLAAHRPGFLCCVVPEQPKECQPSTRGLFLIKRESPDARTAGTAPEPPMVSCQNKRKGRRVDPPEKNSG